MVNKKTKKSSYDIPFLSILLFCVSFVVLLVTLTPYFPKKHKQALFPARPTPTPERIITPSFQCPESEWVNCMPGPDPQNPQCSQAYLNWATENCPGFQGAAL